MANKDFRVAKAMGRGDYESVIAIEEEALKEDPENKYSLSMIASCYENLEDNSKAKEYYSKALDIDGAYGDALEGLARIYYREKNYPVAYEYVKRGLDYVHEEGESIPRWIKVSMAVILKIFKPRTPFDILKAETDALDKNREKWVKWAKEFKEWYEKEYKVSDDNPIH